MATVMTDDTHVDLNSRQEALERRVLLLCPTIGWWKGMYQLPRQNTETTSDGRVVNKDDITTPRAKLVTDKYPVDRNGIPWKKRFQKLESRLGALKEEYSVPFPIQGVRVVPKTKGQELMDRMYGLTLGRLRTREQRLRDAGENYTADRIARQIEEVLMVEGADAPNNTPVYDSTRQTQSIAYDLHVAAKEFCTDWEQIRAQIQSENAVFDQVESRVPRNAGIMRTKFHLDVVPVELAGGIGASQLTQDDLAEHNSIVQEACHRRVEEAIEQMIEGPRDQLAGALASLRELINRDGRVTPKSFKPVRAAIAKIRMFDFVANDALLAQINQLEHRLNITQPNALDRITAAQNGFDAAIEGFMAEVTNAQAQAHDIQEFGREFRAIDID